MGKHIFRLGLIAALSISGVALAEDAGNPFISTATPDPVSLEMTDLFSSYCLDKFPNDAALDQFAKDQGDAPMTGDEVKRVLHDDPGHGWHLKTALGTYTLTIEAPPYHACGVRRAQKTGLSSAQPYMALVKSYATKNNFQVSAPQTINGDLGGQGKSLLFANLLINGGQASGDTFIAVQDAYNDPKDPTKILAVETRFVHQLTNGR